MTDVCQSTTELAELLRSRLRAGDKIEITEKGALLFVTHQPDHNSGCHFCVKEGAHPCDTMTSDKEKAVVTTSKIEVPQVEVPNQEPKIEVPNQEPKIEVPNQEPKIEVSNQEPKIEVSKVEVPKVEVPQVGVAKIEVSQVEVPQAEVPQAEVPQVEVPQAEVPKVEVPKVEVPKVEVPKAEVPKAEVPKVTTDIKVDNPKISKLERLERKPDLVLRIMDRDVITVLSFKWLFRYLAIAGVIALAVWFVGLTVMIATQCNSYETAAFTNDAECVHHVYRWRPLLDRRDGPFAIKHAAGLCHVETFKALLDLRIDPSTDDNYALRHASKNGCIEIVQLLLEDVRVDINAMNGSPLLHAAANGHVTIVETLLKNPKLDPTLKHFAVLKAVYYAHRFEWTEDLLFVWNMLMKDQRISIIQKLDDKTWETLISSYSNKEYRYAVNADCR